MYLESNVFELCQTKFMCFFPNVEVGDTMRFFINLMAWVFLGGKFTSIE